jgi:hypothetical protein
LLHCLLCLLAAFSLYRLSLRGYPLLALTLLPAATLCCWRLARQCHAGARISWQRGEWALEQGPGSRGIKVRRASTCLPWVIYFAWTELATDRRGSVFLLPDSAPAQQLRGLRVRLTLER